MNPNRALPALSPNEFAWPIETEIYILPSGEIVVADLPAELAPAFARLPGVPTLQEDPPATPDDQHVQP